MSRSRKDYATFGASTRRLTRDDLLADPYRIHLMEAYSQSMKAAHHLKTLADQPGITREQARRLRCLASNAVMAAEGAKRILQESVNT